MPIPISRISTYLVIVLAASILAGCGSPRSTADDKSTVEEAVALFIAGDFDGAEILFLEVLDERGTEEDILTAHLYLGRIYLAEKEYEKAANVLSNGKALGGDVRFDEYFEMAARHLRASSSRIIQEESISRGQLAALIHEMFGEVLEGNLKNTDEMGGDGETDNAHWSGAHASFSESSGIMKKLPDGSFHPDEKVTRPAFFVVVSRLTELLGLSGGVMDGLFPDGLGGEIASVDREVEDGGKNRYVSGRQAMIVLNTVAQAAGL